MEEYKTKLGQTEDRQLRQSLERVINIFQSNLFQALIGMIPLHSNPGLVCSQSLSNQSTSSTFPLYCHLPNLLEQCKQVFLFLPGTCLSPTRSTLISTCWRLKCFTQQGRQSLDSNRMVIINMFNLNHFKLSCAFSRFHNCNDIVTTVQLTHFKLNLFSFLSLQFSH